MSWNPLEPSDLEKLEFLYRTLKSGRDTLWHAAKARWGDQFHASQRTVLHDFLDHQNEHQTFQHPAKRSVVAPLQILNHGSYQCDLLSMNNDSGYVAIFSMVETFSRFGFTVALRSKEQQSTATALKTVLDQCRSKGYKVSLLQSDQGVEFKGTFDAMCKKYYIKHILSPPHTPTANAYVERRNSTIRRQLYALMEAANNKQWVKNLQIVTDNINNAPNATTRKAPIDLIEGDSDLKSEAQENIKAVIARRYKTTQIGTPLYVGQTIRLLRIKSRFEKPGSLGYWGQEIYKVVQRINSKYANILPSYRISDLNGMIKYGRFPKSSLLPIPPILVDDEDTITSNEPAPISPENEAPVNTFIESTNNPQPVQPEARRSLRLQNLQNQEDGNEYEIDYVNGKRIYKKHLQYKIHYTGYSKRFDEWRPASEVEALASEAVQDYNRLHPN
jgi:hypothetical protein